MLASALMTYFLEYVNSYGNTNILPYSDKALAEHAAEALRTFHQTDPKIYTLDEKGVIRGD